MNTRAASPSPDGDQPGFSTRQAPPETTEPAVSPNGQSTRPARRSTPPTTIKVVLPVWGYTFVRQFLEVALPALLAPGNVPALRARRPTEFIILTGEDDEPFIRRHPNFRALSDVCTVEIRPIDHLITGENYTTTLTLAFAETIRSAGPAMLDTCFLLLCSDYVIADGSLVHVVDHVMDGASGVLAGNFQVSFDEAFPWLQAELSRSTPALSLGPRVMMRWGLTHLHPTVVANTVNFPLNHNRHTNRLFWRADGQTLVGRFYLMHPIAVRPETTDFVIAASFDYSFIPEMCPSGNVDVIVDSDDYLVVEMQPHDHEAKLLRPGPLRPGALAATLSEWTTERHRENAGRSVVFHAGELPGTLDRTILEADRFTAEVARAMPRKAWSHHNHPYWRGAIAAHHEATGRRLDLIDRWLALGLPDHIVTRIQHPLGRWLLERVVSVLFGQPPFVRPWHPRWVDYGVVTERLRTFVHDPKQRLLIVADRATVFTVSFSDSGERAVRLRRTPFLESRPEVYAPLAGSFDWCLVELNEGELAAGDELLDRIAPLMKPAGQILVTVYNRRAQDAAGFAASIGYHATRLMRAGTTLRETRVVPASRFRWLVSRISVSLALNAYRRPWVGLPLAALGGAPLAVCTLVANAAARGRSVRGLHPGRLATSFHMVLGVDPEGQDAYRYAARPIARQRLLERLRIVDDPVRMTVLARHPDTMPILRGTGHPADERTLAPGAGRGADASPSTATLAAARTDPVWHDDPRRLEILLSRYEFVATMLANRLNVGEVGYGDVLGTRVVSQGVGKVTVYDFDPVVIADIRRQFTDRLPVDAQLHDILAGPLPEAHDGLYSLDVLARTPRHDEHAYLANLKGSLTGEGALVLGVPSLAPPSDGSPQIINRKSGAELKALLENYFTNVFLFSMDDEIIHTGSYPTANYLLAVCCGKKEVARPHE